MKVNVRKMKEEVKDAREVEFTVALKSISDFRQTEILEPMEVKGTFYLTEDGVFLHLETEAKLRIRCSRCLDPFETKLNLRLDGEVVTLAVADERDLEEDVFPMEGEIIDLEALILEELVMKVPMKPLCDKNCKGICDTCGGDLNEKGCQCEPKDPKEDSDPAVDPRLAKLKSLLKED